MQMESVAMDTCTFVCATPPPMLCVETSGRDFSVLRYTANNVYCDLSGLNCIFSLQHSSASKCSPVYWAMCGSHSLSPSF